MKLHGEPFSDTRKPRAEIRDMEVSAFKVVKILREQRKRVARTGLLMWLPALQLAGRLAGQKEMSIHGR